MTDKPKPDLIAGSGIKAIVPRNIDEAWRLATIMVQARMVPSSYEGRNENETTSKVMIGIQKGLEVGFPPITGLANIMVVNGRACIWGDGAVALIQDRGVVKNMKEWIEGNPMEDDWTAHCEIYRVGQDEPYHRTFSVSDAKRAKLWQNPKRQPWMLYPQRMLQMRARAWAIRDGFSDCLSGLSIAEEMQDLPAEQPKVDTAFLDDEPVTATEAIEGSTDASEKLTEVIMDAKTDLLEPVVEKSQEILPGCETCGGKGMLENPDGDKEPCPECGVIK